MHPSIYPCKQLYHYAVPTSVALGGLSAHAALVREAVAASVARAASAMPNGLLLTLSPHVSMWDASLAAEYGDVLAALEPPPQPPSANGVDERHQMVGGTAHKSQQPLQLENVEAASAAAVAAKSGLYQSSVVGPEAGVPDVATVPLSGEQLLCNRLTTRASMSESGGPAPPSAAGVGLHIEGDRTSAPAAPGGPLRLRSGRYVGTVDPFAASSGGGGGGGADGGGGDTGGLSASAIAALAVASGRSVLPGMPSITASQLPSAVEVHNNGHDQQQPEGSNAGGGSGGAANGLLEGMQRQPSAADSACSLERFSDPLRRSVEPPSTPNASREQTTSPSLLLSSSTAQAQLSGATADSGSAGLGAGSAAPVVSVAVRAGSVFSGATGMAAAAAAAGLLAPGPGSGPRAGPASNGSNTGGRPPVSTRTTSPQQPQPASPITPMTDPARMTDTERFKAAHGWKVRARDMDLSVMCAHSVGASPLERFYLFYQSTIRTGILALTYCVTGQGADELQHEHLVACA